MVQPTEPRGIPGGAASRGAFRIPGVRNCYTPSKMAFERCKFETTLQGTTEQYANQAVLAAFWGRAAIRYVIIVLPKRYPVPYQALSTG